MTNEKTIITFEDGKTQKISLKKGEQYYLDFDSVEEAEVEYSIKGKDLILTVKQDSEKEIQGGSIVLKNYASKDVSEGVYYPSPDDLLDDYISFSAAHKKNSFTGTRFADMAESTEKNETFKLGAGSNTISFDTKAGFGKDTVTLTSGEDLTLDISNTDNLSYEVQGKNLVVKANSVSYVAEAKVSGTVDGVEIPENTYSFTLTEYETPDDRNDSLRGKYLFKGCEYGDNGTFEDGKRAIYLTNSDFKEESVTFDGATLSEFRVYKVVNGEKIDITEEYKKGIASANDADDSYNKILAEEEGIGGSIVLKDYAVKDNGAAVTIGEEDSDLAETLEFEVVAGKKNTFTGTRFADMAESTEKNETFKLGAGSNTISFDTKAGFGKDTVTLTSGEDLTLDISNTDNLSYEVQGKNLVVKANSVSYVAEAKVSGTVDGVEIPENTYSFTLTEYETPDDRNDSLRGKYLFKGCEYGDNGTFEDGKRAIYLTNSDFKEESVTFDGATLSEFRVYKVVNGEKIDITEEYKKGIASANDADDSYNKILAEEEGIGGSIVLKDYAVKDNGAAVTIGVEDSDLAETLEFEVVAGKKNTFTGTRLNNTATSTEKNDTFKLGTGKDTITFGENFGKDTVVLSKGEELTLNFAEDTELTYSKNGNNIILTDKNNNSVTIKDYLKGNAMVSVGSDDLTDLINNSESEFLTYGKGADYKKAQTLKGTLLDETFVSGKGNDKLYGGGGTNTYQFAAGSGKDTVYATGEQDTLNFDEDVKLTYSRKGNDIVITGTKTADDKSEVVNQVTVKNYLKGEQYVYVGENELINELNAQGFTYGNAESKKAQKLSGSLLDETFVGGAKADKIYTGSGDDTINAGAGNDTIYVNGEGTKSITIGKADGNDTIVMSSEADLELTYGGEGEPRYVRKGNDLVISYKYSDVEKEQVTTIKNYYKYTDLDSEPDSEYGATLTVNEKR